MTMRHFKGQAFEIINIAEFLKNPSNPDPKSRKPMTDGFAEVTLELQAGLSYFMKPPTFDANLDGQGNFDVAVPDQTTILREEPGAAVKSATLTVFRNEGEMTVLGRKIPLVRTVYRSAAFALSRINSSGHKVSIFFPNLSALSGITQDDVNNEVIKAKAKIQAPAPVESLSAKIMDGYVFVSMRLGNGWGMMFDVSLAETDSSDLDTFVDAKIDNVVTDRPGLAGLTRICKSDDDVKREYLQPAVDTLMVKLNAEIKTAILDAIAEKIGEPEKVVEAVFDSQATLTFDRLRFPVVDSIPGFLGLPGRVRNIVPSPCIGFPRDLG